MLNQNTDLDAIRLLLNQLHHVVDAIEAERLRNGIQDNRLSDHDRRLSDMEKKYEEILQKFEKTDKQLNVHEIRLYECEESSNFAVRKVKQFEYYKDRNEDLETVAAFYLQD